jgi:hypothetical protein
MKTKHWIACAIGCLALGFPVHAEEAKSTSNDAYAEIVFIEGSDLLVLRADGQNSIDDALGLRLYAGDQVQTGSKTSVELVAMPRRSRLRLSENTVITIGALGDNGATTLKLLYGRLRSKVEKLAGTQSPYNVVTRSFVAGVRGTDFGCDLLVTKAGEPASAKIYCFEGSVEVAPSPASSIDTDHGPQSESAGRIDAPPETPKPKAEEAFAPVLVPAGAMAVIESRGKDKAVEIVERPIDTEIKTFWKANEFTNTQPVGFENGAREAAPGALPDSTQIRKGIRAKNNAMIGSLIMFASGAALDIASLSVRKDDEKLADGLLIGGAACAAMGLPVMILSITINPMKGIKP